LHSGAGHSILSFWIGREFHAGNPHHRRRPEASV
jgi:hypothetical protein